MRWFWIDRFTELVSGKYAESVKNVSLAEEQIPDYAPGQPYLPASLIVEGVAQTGGLLIAQLSDFKNRVVLAKISRSTFHQVARPGCTLIYRVELVNLQGQGASVRGTAHIGDSLQAEIELMFAWLDDRFNGVELFEPAQLCHMLRNLRVFEVGRHEDGSPISVPQYMLDAEQQFIG
jgi:3-hydroxyacyl-[acyl-carrier-protein] dehydratase